MTVDGLTLEHCLADGWTGETWAGSLDGHPVVVRRVTEGSDPFAAARLAREVAALARAAGPGVPEVVRTGETAGAAFMAVERIDGPDLLAARPIAAATGPELARTLLPVAAALARAHGCGVVHRDVAPGNVVVGGDGGVLIDFGACAVDGVTLDGLTPSGWPVSVATPGFTPPEGATSAEPSRDVWAFGRLLTWCLDRFSAGDEARALIGPVADACTQVDQTARPTMSEVAARLASLAGDHGVRLRPAGQRGRTPGPTQTRIEASGGGPGARGAELTRLAERLSGAFEAARLEVVLVLGRTGIGKSWLVDRAARRARAEGVRVLRARCTDEVGDLRALRGWIDGSARQPEADDLTNRFARLTGVERADQTSLDVDPERVPFLVAAFLAAQGPVLAILEDLHHAEAELLAVLERLPRTGFARGMLVASARPGRIDADDIDGATVPLVGLPADAVRALVEPAGPIDVEAVVEAADGNPFAALELAAAARRGDPVDGSLLDLVEARLRRVATDRRGLLLAAAAGAVFWPEAIGAGLPDAVPDLLRGRVIRPLLESDIMGSTAYEWSHTLLREVAYGGFAADERANGHMEVAAGLARWDNADAERVAYHGITAFRLGETAARDLTVEFASRAVVAAAHRASATAAAAWLATVREVGGRPDARIREELGDVARQVGNLELAAAGLADALLADRTDCLGVARRIRKGAIVLREIGWTDRAARWTTRADAWIARADPGAAAEIEAVKVDLAAASIALLRADRTTAEARARAALARAEAIGDDDLIGRSHLQLEMHASEVGSPERAAHAAAALEALERSGRGWAIAALRTNLGVSAHDAGRYGEALEHYEVVLELADRRSDALGRAIVLNNMAETLTLLGRLDEAEAALVRASDLFVASRYQLGVAVVHAAQARIAIWRGDRLRARDHLDAAGRRYDELGVPVYAADLALRWAEWAVLGGDADEARRHLADARRLLADLGDVAVLPYTERRLGAGLAMLEGDDGGAAALLGAAAAEADDAGVPYEATVMRAWWARALHAAGDPAARRASEVARRAVNELGLGLLPVPQAP